MPAQQAVWLHDEDGLLPVRTNLANRTRRRRSVLVNRWPLHLPLENGQLVSQEGIFCHEFGLASAKISEICQRQKGNVRFGPTSNARGDRIQAAIQEAPEMGQNTSHTKNFSIT